MTNTAAKIPATFAALFTRVEIAGGEVVALKPRMWQIRLPRRYTDGVHQINVGTVGYYVRDGKNQVSGHRAIHTEMNRRGM
jgi:hypothetical protein